MRPPGCRNRTKFSQEFQAGWNLRLLIFVLEIDWLLSGGRRNLDDLPYDADTPLGKKL